MKLYADLPARRTAQIASDVGMLLWVGLWVWAGRAVHAATMRLAAPGEQLRGAGAGFRDQMGRAGAAVGDVPVVGEQLAAPFTQAGRAGTDIEAAGQELVDAVTRLAQVLGLTTALVPILLGLLLWGALRARFVRRATAAQRLIDSSADLDLFALRAMAHQPMRRLAAVSPDPAGAWRAGDAATIRALAVLELRDSGLRPPSPAPR